MKNYLLPLFICFSLFSSARAADPFTIRVYSDLGHLDWNQGEVQPLIMDQIMEGLTAFDEKTNLKPALAESWKATPDQRIWTFKLRPRLKWSDGSPLCADDFVRSWRRLLSKSVASPFAFYLFFVKNAQAIATGKQPSDSLGVKALDCRTLQVQLEQPVAFFPEITTHWVTFPIAEKKADASFENALTAGPFAIATWKKGEELILKKNPHYYDAAKVRLEKLRVTVVADDQTALRLFDEGRIDWMKDLPFQERPTLLKRADVKAYPTKVYFYLLFSLKNQPLPKSTRCAVIRNINTQEIPIFLQGREVPLTGWLSAAIAPAPGKSLTPENELTFHYYAKDIHEPLMQWLQAQMQTQLRQKISLKKWESKTYWSMLTHTPPPVFLGGSTLWFRHPYAMALEFRKSSGANFGGFESSEYEKLAETLLKTKAPTKKLLAKMDEVLIQKECAMAPLYQRTTLVLSRPNLNIPPLNDLARISFKTTGR